MTKEEFETQYAEQSKVSIQFLHDHNRFALPCSCDSDMCQGWQMAHVSKEIAALPVCSPEFHTALGREEFFCPVCRKYL